MAHTCPDCGQLCHCNGDFDDIDFGDDCPEALDCIHYKSCDEAYDNGEDEEPEWDGALDEF